MKFAIVVSEFNEDVTNGLLKGAKTYLQENKIEHIDIFKAPGAFETPILAKNLAQKKNHDGIICLGAVIKGDTAHFEFISLGATMGIMQAMLETNTPISFGILTTYTDEQATARSRNDAHNKGREAAAACLKTAVLLKEIRKN